MGNKGTKDLEKEEYEESCKIFKDFLTGQEKELKIEEAKNNINKKFDDKAKKDIILVFIKTLIEKEKKEKILKNMKEIFINLFKQYDQIHKKEDDPVKTFSETADDNEKNIINAIYISKIFDDEEDIEDAKIHDYAVYLYGEDEVKKIEDGENENIDEDFKSYKDDKFDSEKQEI